MTSIHIMELYVGKEGCYEYIPVACGALLYDNGSFFSFACQTLSSDCGAGGPQRWRNIPIFDIVCERGGVALHQPVTDGGLSPTKPIYLYTYNIYIYIYSVLLSRCVWWNAAAALRV
jgi:hypothetical protein